MNERYANGNERKRKEGEREKETDDGIERKELRKMRNVRVDVFCYLIVALLFLAPGFRCSGGASNLVRPCDINKGESQCGEFERCFQNSLDENAYCKCQIGYELLGEDCVAATTVASVTTAQPHVEVNSGGSSVAAGLLIPTFLIVTGVLLYFIARRYKWLQRVRQLRPNHYGTVLVTRDDDDDDDPPIA